MNENPHRTTSNWHENMISDSRIPDESEEWKSIKKGELSLSPRSGRLCVASTIVAVCGMKRKEKS